MTAEPVASTRTVVLKRADRPGWWAPGYWSQLVGCGLRIPAGVVNGRVVDGYLVAVDESGEDEIVLTFSDLEPEAG